MGKGLATGRLEDVGWALLFVMSGAILLVPGIPNPWGVWLLGTGLILLGVNGVRYARGIRPNLFSAGVGVIALVSGAGEFLNVDLPILALGLLLVGALILLKPLTRGRPVGSRGLERGTGWRREGRTSHRAGDRRWSTCLTSTHGQSIPSPLSSPASLT